MIGQAQAEPSQTRWKEKSKYYVQMLIMIKLYIWMEQVLQTNANWDETRQLQSKYLNVDSRRVSWVKLKKVIKLYILNETSYTNKCQLGWN